MKAPVPVLCAGNAAYLAPMSAMLASVVAHFDPARRLVLHVVESNFTTDDRAALARGVEMNTVPGAEVELHWHILDPVLLGADFPTHRRISADAMARLLAPELLPECDRVIYLDGDLIVLADLGQLYDATDGNDEACLHAVQDISIPFVSSPLGVPDYRQRGLRPEAHFFNSGVLVINLRRWREEQIGGRALAYLRDQSGVVTTLDQRALNAVCADRWAPLDQRWNQSWTILFPELWDRCGYTSRDWNIARLQPRIVHFAGDDKPWTPGNYAPRSSWFFAWLRRTPLAGRLHPGTAARVEGLIGPRLYYRLWRGMRRVFCLLKGRPFVSP